MLLVTMCRPFFRNARATPNTAMLSASVPPPVKTISPSCAPSNFAMRTRASSIAARASRPNTCTLLALPKCSRRYGNIASSTAGSSGVVALWSA